MRIPRESAFPPAPEHIRAAGRNQRYKLLSHTLAPFVSGPGAFEQASWTKEGLRAGYEPCKSVSRMGGLRFVVRQAMLNQVITPWLYFTVPTTHTHTHTSQARICGPPRT